MIHERAFRRDLNLLVMAKNIFGDIVQDAYVSTYYYPPFRKEEETKQRLEDEVYSEVAQEIDNCAKDIVITFANGNSVMFTNSEWGRISKVDMAEATFL